MPQIFLALFLILSISCQSETPEESGNYSAPNNTSSSDDADSEKAFTGKLCKDLDLPSWQRVVARISEKRCVDCHNTEFSWNDIELDSYESFKKNGPFVVERLASGELSIEITGLERILINEWVEIGMPQTEEDCPQDKI